MIRVDVVNRHPRYRIPHVPVKRYVRSVLARERRCSATVGVVFVDGRAIAILNRRYLGHRGSTDVISFVLEADADLEGEMYINIDKVGPQSREYGVSFSNELARLVVHGTLHLAGYDDRTKHQREVMRREEDRHLRRWFEK